MKKTLIALLAAGALSGCVENLNTSSISAAQGAYAAASFSDADARTMADQAATESDSQNKLSPTNSAYSKRLARIVKGVNSEDGLPLNFRVYETDEINAFAMANGTVRVYSGLMDKMSDDEIRFVIGHEIGHVALGHSRKAMQVALATNAARNAAASTGGKVAVLSGSELADFTEGVINAQFSQKQESDADEYAVSFTKRHGWNPKAGLSVMKKLQALEGNSSGASLLSSHPASKDREQHIKSLL
ncbi:M48 family metalloprotease [Pokkaliibacter sp. CJK22405]|uniref:M48 family metalloprotease n=1 Tax=Pokkaliibacter sp. CJK22405 TaxID=3384615 RepID=UPI003985675F